MNKEQQLMILGLIVSIVVGLGVMAFRQAFPEKGIAGVGEVVEKSSIVVQLSGAVAKAGVYQLKSGERLLQLIELAGGALPNADLAELNLAEVLKDGERVIVPSKTEVVVNSPIVQMDAGGQPQGQKINLNSATEQEFDSLPGIGPAMAHSIVERRRSKGPFTRLEQLMEVPRLGKARFKKLKGRIIV